ncbi:MAG: MarR family transcriptional regulator [Acidimicrobiales bacterium]|nr:MarR family transcriptional regulator [Acidimicrobiales bacterium]
MAAHRTAADPLEHPHLTTVGLLVETHAGFTSAAERGLGATGGLSLQWFELLLRLARTPGHRLRMSALAAQTTLSASGLTRAVDRLEAEGLVRREACPTDRRSSYAALTGEGEARLRRVLPHHLEHLVEVFDRTFDAEELATLCGLLRRLRDAVNPQAACASSDAAVEVGAGTAASAS